MQTDWELSKENFQPLKRGRKEVNKPVGLLDDKTATERQRRQEIGVRAQKPGFATGRCFLYMQTLLARARAVRWRRSS